MNAPHFDSEHATIWHGDCLDVMRSLPDASIDACVTDPPYDLTAGKKGGTGAASINLDSPYGRSRIGTGNGAGGFMGKAWDATGIAFDVATWSEVYRVLKPGGWVLSFGGTRTFHRMAVAIEDAGFEIRDSIAWLYGSGFPKSLDVSKAIDKRPGVERHPEFAAELKAAIAANGYTNTFDVAEKVIGRRTGAVANWQKYQWPEAKWWPALRDLLGMDGAKWDAVIAEAERIKTGVHDSAVWSPASMPTPGITSPDRRDDPATAAARRWQGWGTALKPAFEPVVVARKPLGGTVAGNVLKWGTGALNIDASRIGHASEADLAASQAKNPGRIDTVTSGVYGAGRPQQRVNTTGRWPTNVILDEHTAPLLDEQAGAVGSNSGTPTRADGTRNTDGLFSPGAAGTSQRWETRGAGASRFFYTAKASTDERPSVDGIAHPTVKPLDLMRWLVRLVTPKGGTVLEPFAGSGTTVEAAVLEGFRCIAIEREADYLPLIMQRVSKPHAIGLDFGDWEDAS